MPLTALDHLNLRTAQLARLKAFYVEVLGLKEGPRPAFSFGGAWLYLGERACVHLVEVDEEPTPGSSLRMEHVAFSAEGYAEFIAGLEARGIPYRLGHVDVPTPSGVVKITQVNVFDPEGNHVHVDFEEGPQNP